MRLQHLRISNCFGFANTTADLTPNLVYILGRNSSGKTALLDAINNLAPDRVPKDHPRFTNFISTGKSQALTATFTVNEVPSTDVTTLIAERLRNRGISEQMVAQHQPLQNALTQLREIYTNLFQDIATNGTLTLTKFASGHCQLTVGEQYKEATERRKTIDNIMNGALPNGVITVAGTNHQIGAITSADLDRQAATVMPPLMYYTQEYNLTDDLPDYITSAITAKPPNSLTGALLELLDTNDVNTLLTTNDPDQQDRLRATIQTRADNLAATISKDTNRLIQLTVSLTPNGLQITPRADAKKSFYRHLSDATKFLIAYHAYAQGHEPGAILLFDEPSRGMHASAETYLRDFLERLSNENHVIVSTHSEHLLDLAHLDAIRLMQQDDEDRPIVLNNLRPPRDKENYLLALQPVFDAIGIAYTHHVLTKDKTILTEGLTDYLYLEALLTITKTDHAYGIAPGRGESSMFTIIPFFISQGVRLKIILDTTALKEHLQASYGIPDDACWILPGTKKTRGIEDLFTTNDFQKLLKGAGIDATSDDLQHGNSIYAKQVNKRLVAHTFLTNANQYTLAGFEQQTQENISSVLDFCADDHWFTI